MGSKPRIAIIGAGMGGLAAAAALGRFGFDVRIFEQADRFTRLGAGIQMSPNAMKALRGLGIEDRVRGVAFQPESWMNRRSDNGEMMFELPLGTQAERTYGAPYLQMHRGDLHDALMSAVPPTILHLSKRLVDIGPEAELRFADGTTESVDLIVGADGLHSRVREILVGPQAPSATGRVAYRATFAASHLRLPVGECTKWWGDDRHIVIYFTTSRRDELYFVTSLPDADWVNESWSATGDMAVVRDAFAGFHEEVREVLRACPSVHRWAILDREPLAQWHDGHAVLIGDAAHPMTPYMAQGAAMALEDGVMLARALSEWEDIATALDRFEASRKARTAEAQAISHANTWMREKTDPSWCYGFDPWSQAFAV